MILTFQAGFDTNVWGLAVGYARSEQLVVFVVGPLVLEVSWSF
jgi:hypothetical protein